MVNKNSKKKPRVLIFMLAYNAAKTICDTIKRLPTSNYKYELEALIIDDASDDNTFNIAKKFKKKK